MCGLPLFIIDNFKKKNVFKPLLRKFSLKIVPEFESTNCTANTKNYRKDVSKKRNKICK